MENTVGNRNSEIIKAGILSVVTNIILSVGKALIGFFTKSIAVTLDAVNNLSDAISGIVTIFGAKLSGKEPNKKHPLGFGRIEYISAMVVAGLVLYAGIASLVESIKKIINPTVPEYTKVTLMILGIAVIIKLILFKFMKSQGEKFNSLSLVASGKDAGFDGILSLSVLIAALVYMKTGISLEAYVGIILSIVIIKSGLEMMIDTVDELLGMRVDKKVSDRIKDIILEDEAVTGAYDLILNSYGPDKQIGSVHIEIADKTTADKIDVISRRIGKKVFDETGILLTGIGIYSKNTENKDILIAEERIREIVSSYEEIIQMHGFYMDTNKKIIAYDIIISFEIKERDGIYKEILEKTEDMYPDYRVYINMDIDI